MFRLYVQFRNWSNEDCFFYCTVTRIFLVGRMSWNLRYTNANRCNACLASKCCSQKNEAGECVVESVYAVSESVNISMDDGTILGSSPTESSISTIFRDE